MRSRGVISFPSRSSLHVSCGLRDRPPRRATASGAGSRQPGALRIQRLWSASKAIPSGAPKVRLHLVGGRSDQILYLLPKPDLAGRTALRLSALEFLDRLATNLPPPRFLPHRYHGVFAPNAPLRPLVTARAQEDNALATQLPGPDPELPQRSPPSPPEPEKPPRQPSETGPPQTELAMGPNRGEEDEAARESFPDDLDQSPEFDPADPEPIPQDDFDQSWGA